MTEQNSKLQGYIILRKLHKASHSKVKLVQCENRATKFVAHIFKLPEFNEFFQKEVNNLQILNTTHFVRMIESSPNGVYSKKTGEFYECMYIIIEYLPMGCLFDLVNESSSLSDCSIRYIFRQLLNAISELHDNDLCHRSLSPMNILFDENYNLKISGITYAEALSDNSHSRIGGDKFLAPEVNKLGSYRGDLADAFSLGVILFFLKLKRKPFTSTSTSNIFLRLFEDKQKYWKSFDKTNSLSPSFKSLIEALIDPSPLNRISVQEILSHPWTQEQTNSLELFQLEINQINQNALENAKSHRSNFRQHFNSQNFRSDFEPESPQLLRLKEVYNQQVFRSNIIHTNLHPKELLSKVRHHAVNRSIELEFSQEFYQVTCRANIYQDTLEYKAFVYAYEEFSVLQIDILKGNYFDFYELLTEIKKSIY